MFLTQGVTSKYPPYSDKRTKNVENAINFANCADLLVMNLSILPAHCILSFGLDFAIKSSLQICKLWPYISFGDQQKSAASYQPLRS